MMQETIYWLALVFLAIAFVRICFSFLPRWFLAGIAVLILGEILHPRVIEDLAGASADLLSTLVVLFLVLVSLRWMFKGFSRRKKNP